MFLLAQLDGVVPVVARAVGQTESSVATECSDHFISLLASFLHNTPNAAHVLEVVHREPMHRFVDLLSVEKIEVVWG